MKLPNSVVWQLTKKWNAFIVQGNNNQQFSKDPLNLTGLHNASSSGLANNHAIGLQGVKAKSKGNKRFKAGADLLVKHKTHNQFKKQKKVSQSKSLFSRVQLRRGLGRAAKVIQGLTHISEKTRQLALKRLGKLHSAQRVHVKGHAAKKAEEKK